MLAMSTAQGQSTPAAPTPPTAAKAADAKATAPAATPATAAAKPADAKNPDPKAQPATGATKPAAADAKKPADTPNKTAAAATATPTAAPNATPAKGDPAKSPPAAPGATPAAATKTADAEAEKPAKPEGPPCVVAEFRAIGMGTQDVTKRRTQAQTWLKQRAKQCSVEQLLMIRNNRSQWMGTADSAGLAVTVDSLLEALAVENPRVAALLYGTPPPPAREDEKK